MYTVIYIIVIIMAFKGHQPDEPPIETNTLQFISMHGMQMKYLKQFYSKQETLCVIITDLVTAWN